MSEGINVMVMLPNKWSREMVIYYFNYPISGISQTNKELSLASIMKHM